jgi:hypothetical protein
MLRCYFNPKDHSLTVCNTETDELTVMEPLKVRYWHGARDLPGSAGPPSPGPCRSVPCGAGLLPAARPGARATPASGQGAGDTARVGARGRWKRPFALSILILPLSHPQRLPQQRQLRGQLLTLRPYQLRPRHRLEERHLVAHRGPVSGRHPTQPRQHVCAFDVLTTQLIERAGLERTQKCVVRSGRKVEEMRARLA